MVVSLVYRIYIQERLGERGTWARTFQTEKATTSKAVRHKESKELISAKESEQNVSRGEIVSSRLKVKRDWEKDGSYWALDIRD